MKKRLVTLLVAGLTMLTFAGCKVDATGGLYTEHIYVDGATGVNYIEINSNSGVAITPRLNADGSLYVSK